MESFNTSFDTDFKQLLMKTKTLSLEQSKLQSPTAAKFGIYPMQMVDDGCRNEGQKVVDIGANASLNRMQKQFQPNKSKDIGFSIFSSLQVEEDIVGDSNSSSLVEINLNSTYTTKTMSARQLEAFFDALDDSD